MCFLLVNLVRKITITRNTRDVFAISIHFLSIIVLLLGFNCVFICNVIGVVYWLSQIASFKRIMDLHMMSNSMVMMKMLC
jgi:hypothetical protein